MKWRGETLPQWEARTGRWHEAFALLPEQMDCGAWVWLERYETRRCRRHNNRDIWQSRPARRIRALGDE
jgi:hypothetical protein